MQIKLKDFVQVDEVKQSTEILLFPGIPLTVLDDSGMAQSEYGVHSLKQNKQFTTFLKYRCLRSLRGNYITRLHEIFTRIVGNNSILTKNYLSALLTLLSTTEYSRSALETSQIQFMPICQSCILKVHIQHNNVANAMANKPPLLCQDNMRSF